jgi:hypothetical protein
VGVIPNLKLGLDPSDPTVVAAISFVRWEVSLDFPKVSESGALRQTRFVRLGALISTGPAQPVPVASIN